jgi:hypothetical protein
MLFLNSRPCYSAPSFDTGKVQEITGLTGKWNDDEKVFKISKPRTDVKVIVDNTSMPPFMGLTSWVGFTAGKSKNLMIMGDLVLFEDEVNSVMSILFDNGIDVTALHNHFFYDNPKAYFMHIAAEGNLEFLGKGVKAAFDKIQEIRTKNSQPQKTFGGEALPEKSSINSEQLSKIFGAAGEAKDGMFKVVFGRKVKMKCDFMAGKDMGVNTWAAFIGSNENAAVDGDFAVLEDELQGVLRSLRKSNINIVAIHHHMTGESPRILFQHYWGKGKADDLAQAITQARQLQEKKN